MITAKFCNALAQTANKLADGGSENNGSEFGEFCYSNDGGLRWAPGTTRLTTKNYFAKAAYGDPTLGGNAEDAMLFVVGGHRVPITGSNYHILYNVTTGGYAYVQGVSYTTVSNQIGTLITPWQSIKEGSYIAATGDTLIYQDKSGKWLKVTLETGAELRAILDDRCIVINTPSFYNMIDSENGKLYHYATDYNGRIQYGSNSFTQFVGVLKTSSSGYTAYSYIRYTGDAVNPMYKVMPKEIVTSQIRPIVPRYRVAVGQEVAINSGVPDNNAQPIDIFYSDQNSTVCNYKYSLKNGKFISRSILEGLEYPGSSSSAIYLVPSLLADYVNGAGNNDFVIENYDAYILTFYDNKPVLNYSASTQVSSFYDEKSHFFVIQGQTYGIMNHKLYSLLYSSGSISQMDAIIDLGDLEYIGNNPMIAFFWDPATRVVRSFTGDANLAFFTGATKITEYNKAWYDETTQSIFASTNAGLLVIGSRNNYLIRDWKNVTNAQFTKDGISHITNGDETIDFKYYHDDEYTVKPIELETSFYGIGADATVTIDKWSIHLYDLEGRKEPSYIKCTVRSINDITTKSEEKTYKITPDMYDKWSSGVLINFNPRLIKGQGLKLYIETPLIIERIIPHVADQGYSTPTSKTM